MSAEPTLTDDAGTTDPPTDGQPTDQYVSLIGLKTLGMMLLRELLESLLKKLVKVHNLDRGEVRAMLDKLSAEYA